MTPNGPRDDWDDDSGLEALTFPVPVDDVDPGLDALAQYPPDSHHDAESGIVLGASGPRGDDAGPVIPVVQISNPPGTIAVTAYMNGSVAQVDLSPNVARLTEAELAEAIGEVARVAAKRATAVVHVAVVEMLVDQGVSPVQAREFVESNMPFATPAQAEAALAELSVRYAQQLDQA